MNEEEFDWPSYIDSLWKRENLLGDMEIEGKGGYKNGKYHPYITPNGNIDIGPGFDMSYQSAAFKEKAEKVGFTKKELNDSVKNSLLRNSKWFYDRIKQEGGNPKTLTKDVYTGLLDMQWELGQPNFERYNKFWKSVANQDYNGMREESLTKYRNAQNVMQDNISRWNYRKQTYFHDPKPASLSILLNSKNEEKPDALRVAKPYISRSIRNYQYGGKLFGEGGDKKGPATVSTSFVPSDYIKGRIAQWEGSSMKTNRSFEAEARDFNKAIPQYIQRELSPAQLDSLYSYGYNVGMGALKQRVRPMLERYIHGDATAEDVAGQMTAKLDSKYRGLRERRKEEQQMFINNPKTVNTGDTSYFDSSAFTDPADNIIFTPEYADMAQTNSDALKAQQQAALEATQPAISWSELFNNEQPAADTVQNTDYAYSPADTRQPFELPEISPLPEVVPLPEVNSLAEGGRMKPHYLPSFYDDTRFQDMAYRPEIYAGGGSLGHHLYWDGSELQKGNQSPYLVATDNTMPTIQDYADAQRAETNALLSGRIHTTAPAVVRAPKPYRVNLSPEEYRQNLLTVPRDNVFINNGEVQNPQLAGRTKEENKLDTAIGLGVLGAMTLPIAGSTILGASNAIAAKGVADAGIAASNALASNVLGTGAKSLLGRVLTNPYIDAGLTSVGLTSAGNDVINNNLNAGTVLGLMPLGVTAKPLYNGIKEMPNIILNGGLWDPYTTFEGRLGNWGNNKITRLYGTVSRRFNLPDVPRVPADAFRKLVIKEGEIVPVTNGYMDFTGSKRLGYNHTNFTLDRGVTSHNNWWGDMFDTYAVPTQKVLNYAKETPGSLKSIEPSDMFLHGSNRLLFNPKEVTLISGDKAALIKAKDAGMQTLSSPKLRRLFKEQKDNYQKELELYNNHMLFQKPSLPKATGLNPEYASEINRLITQRGTPTLKDFHLLENQTGLKTGVTPLSEYYKAIKELQAIANPTIKDILNNNLHDYIYPNGRVVNWSDANKELELINRAKYNKVFYDPATYAEYNWRIRNTGINQ